MVKYKNKEVFESTSVDSLRTFITKNEHLYIQQLKAKVNLM